MDQETAIQEAARRIAASRYCTALVGAGMSKESGIPTFRGEGGLWTRLGEPPMNGYQLFLEDPRAWWLERLEQQRNPPEFARAITDATPNPGHHALADLEQRGYLKHLITQNVDGLHLDAGSTAITEIHGNRRKLRCIACGRRGPTRDFVEDDVPPVCDRCGGVVKADTVMFGEPIPPAFLASCHEHAGRSDLMLVIGTSATVYPAADFPMQVLRRGGAIIEVNVDETLFTPYAAVALRGPSGELLPRLVEALQDDT
ncbi:MAG: SIR2 family NAD-dependent protein deacylase, partial [Dehalococcoidia bacterium]